MYKSEFIEYITKNHLCTKVEAEKIINIFTSSVINALAEGKEITIIGFGKFYTRKADATTGYNPKTREPITIGAHTQPKFSAGQKLKDACNKA